MGCLLLLPSLGLTAAIQQDCFVPNSSVMAQQHYSTRPICVARNTGQRVKTKAAAHINPWALFGHLHMDFMQMPCCYNYKYILVTVSLFLEIHTLQKNHAGMQTSFPTLSCNFQYEVHSHSWRFHKMFSGGLSLSLAKSSAQLGYELVRFQRENPIPLKDQALCFLPFMFQASQMVSLFKVTDRLRAHCLEI